MLLPHFMEIDVQLMMIVCLSRPARVVIFFIDSKCTVEVLSSTCSIASLRFFVDCALSAFIIRLVGPIASGGRTGRKSSTIFVMNKLHSNGL